jgi:predicted DNA-binding protein
MATSRIVKVSAHLPVETVELLERMASDRGTTMTEIVRRALDHEAYFMNVLNAGGKVLTEARDGRMFQIELK